MLIATRTLVVEAVRAQFPALGLQIDGQRAVFLDNPAGTQVRSKQSIGWPSTGRP